MCPSTKNTIFQITPADHTLIRTGVAYFAPILQYLNVDITKARYSDYEKPLYSGIAASIKLALKTAGKQYNWYQTIYNNLLHRNSKH